MQCKLTMQTDMTITRQGNPPPKRGGGGGGGGSSPSSSSSDFEFTVSLSPSSRRSSTHLCPADELFYKGQLLPLHLSPRISMVRTLLLSSSSTSSSSTDTNTTASRDSNGSSSSSSSSSSGVPAELLLLLPECDSSRPSSVTEEEARRAVPPSAAKRNKYFTSFANRFSSVFLNRGGSKKDLAPAADTDIDYYQTPPPPPPPPGKRANATAKEVIKKYVKKVKPLYERLSPSQKNQSLSLSQSQKKKTFSFSIRRQRDISITGCNIAESLEKLDEEEDGETAMRAVYPHAHSSSFSGNLRFPRRKKCAGSCPSSMRSSPTHSGLLRVGGGGPGGFPTDPPGLLASSSSSSMEELQSAIQGAIAHCKSTMLQSHQRKSLSIDVTPAAN